ncbi:NUDIX hydrolase family protein [Arcanobacterium haemolyticum]|nr:NUDIX hydrolase family protein [Arcanobacterium haemolyticum]
MSEIDSADMGPWLSPEELTFVRRKVPIVYVDIVPIRVDEVGSLEAVGMLLCVEGDRIIRAFPTGRVLYHERVRDAIARHIEKDLGPVALPQIPASITPFTIGEYFPTPGEGWFDERQHAISLAYLVPMQGDCNPGSDSLEFTWFTPGEARTPELQSELSPAHAALLKQALAKLGEI